MRKNLKILILLALLGLLVIFLSRPSSSGRSGPGEKPAAAAAAPQPRRAPDNLRRQKRIPETPAVSPEKIALKTGDRRSAGAGTAPLVLESSSGRKSVLGFRMPEFTMTEELRDGLKMQRLHCPPGTAVTRRRGAPALPVYSMELAVVSGRQYRLRLENPVWEEIPCLPPVPGDGMRKRKKQLPPAAPDPAIYHGTKPYPEAACRLVPVGGIRGVAGCRIQFMPMQYLPDKGRMRICRRGRLVLEDPALPENTPLPPADAYHDFASLQRRVFANGDRLPETRSAGGTAAPGHLILVFPSGWRPGLAEFITWKKELGFTVQEAIYGNPGLKSPSQLKSWLAAQAQATHVILCGDGSILPPFRRNTSYDPVYYDQVLSDIPYSLFGDSGDFYPDVFLSRITAESRDALKQILGKLQAGEIAAPEEDVSWRKMGAFMGSNEGGTGQEDRVYMEEERQKLIQAGIFAPGCPALYDGEFSQVGPSQVEQVFQNGTPYFVYLGHGAVEFFATSGFDSDQAAGLANFNRLPLILAPVCDNGMFLNSLARNCLAEAFLENPSGGALAFMGSTNETSWDPPIAHIREMSRILIDNGRSRPGRLQSLGAWNYRAVQAGVKYCLDQAETGEAQFYLHELHLFGDCSQIPRVQAPAAPRVRFRLQASELRGTVTLPDGGALPDMRVVVRCSDGSSRQLLTDGAGGFVWQEQDCGKAFAGLQVLDSLLAIWRSRPRRLQVRYGSGGGTCWSGQLVEIAAEACPPGRKFLYWRGGGSSLLTVEQRGRRSLELVMPDSDLELTAVLGAAPEP